MSQVGRTLAEDQNMQKVFLLPGEVYCATTPSLVTTILGSCVATCIWDPMLRIGGMNHYVLPCGGEDEPSTRYGRAAVRQLIERMIAAGSRVQDLRAKVFGGAAVLPIGAAESTVGERNVQVALEELKRHRIPVMASRTGGSEGMLIRLNTESGDVLIRKIPPGSDVGSGQDIISMVAD